MKTNIKIFGSLFGSLSSIILYTTILLAYLNKSKSIIIKIDVYGESTLELIAILIASSITIISTYIIIKECLHQ